MPRELSGGMQQRASIVRCLSYDPDVILMDEPFGALDAFTRDEMNLLIQKIWMETGKTIIFVTHNVTEAIFLADRVVVLTPRPGRLAHIFPVDLPRPRTIEHDLLAGVHRDDPQGQGDDRARRPGQHGGDGGRARSGLAARQSTIIERRSVGVATMASELRETIPTFNQAEAEGEGEVSLTNWSALTSAGFARNWGEVAAHRCWSRWSSSAALEFAVRAVRYPELHLSAAERDRRRALYTISDLFWPHLLVTLQELFDRLCHRRQRSGSSWRR